MSIRRLGAASGVVLAIGLGSSLILGFLVAEALFAFAGVLAGLVTSGFLGAAVFGADLATGFGSFVVGVLGTTFLSGVATGFGFAVFEVFLTGASGVSLLFLALDFSAGLSGDGFEDDMEMNALVSVYEDTIRLVYGH